MIKIINDMLQINVHKYSRLEFKQIVTKCFKYAIEKQIYRIKIIHGKNNGQILKNFIKYRFEPYLEKKFDVMVYEPIFNYIGDPGVTLIIFLAVII